jgi:hypothetical protein
MSWGTGDDLLTANLKKSVEDDYENYLFTVGNVNNKVIFSQEIKLRTGPFGMCFVKAMQLDDDPELEVIFYTNNNSKKYSSYADVNNGKIEIKNYEMASAAAHKLIENRLRMELIQMLLIFLITLSLPFLVYLFFSRLNR